MAQLIDIYNEWVNNAQFRQSFRLNPEAALKAAGFKVTPDDLNKIKAKLTIDKSNDEELDDRISK